MDSEFIDGRRENGEKDGEVKVRRNGKVDRTSSTSSATRKSIAGEVQSRSSSEAKLSARRAIGKHTADRAVSMIAHADSFGEHVVGILVGVGRREGVGSEDVPGIFATLGILVFGVVGVVREVRVRGRYEYDVGIVHFDVLVEGGFRDIGVVDGCGGGT